MQVKKAQNPGFAALGFGMFRIHVETGRNLVRKHFRRGIGSRKCYPLGNKVFESCERARNIAMIHGLSNLTWEWQGIARGKPHSSFTMMGVVHHMLWVFSYLQTQ